MARIKAEKVIIEGEEQIIVPDTLPSSPADGHYAIDSSDGKLKVYNATKARWIILGDASDIVFNNSTNNFDSTNVQNAIEEVAADRFQYAQFQALGTLNSNLYLFSGTDQVGGLLSSPRRSGNTSNGYRYSNSAPTTASFTGSVVNATASITGIAQSTGSASSSVQLLFELWKVGFNSEGTKLGDITFDISSSSYTIGAYWNSSILTSFAGNQNQSVDITAGDLLGLKFISQTGNNKVVSIQNVTVVLEIRGSI